jgi:hypothetical protein
MSTSSIAARLRARARWPHAVALLTIAFIIAASLSLFTGKTHAQATQFQGFHEFADCTTISGWAWDSTKPNTPISVDIFSNGVLLATVPADQFRQDLLDNGIGNGNHAFSFTPPGTLVGGESILVRFANTNINLLNSPRTFSCNSNLGGIHERADCTTISGWAWDAHQPDASIFVDVYFDNNPFVSVRAPANQFRQDLLDAGYGNGNHGFSFPTPMSLKNGQPHTITIKIANTNINLGGTGKTITCQPPGPPLYDGFHEVANCTVISGWAWDSTQPNTPISVDIYNGGTVIATVIANQFRQDLLDAGKGNGQHAFTFLVPNSLKNGQNHLISVAFSGTTTGLFNTGKTINCPPPGGPDYQGFHETADCTAITGWAWDSTQPNTPISVDIYSDGMLVMTVAANQFRQDLFNAGVGNGNHGFSFTVPMSLKDGQSHSISVKFAGTSTDLLNTPKTITCP